jgi:hypothetical protein
MKHHRRSLSHALAAAGLVLYGGPARAGEPTTADCLAASDASLKLGNEHRLRAERSQLLVCAAGSCPGDIRQECVRRVDEVNTAIPTIIFEVRDAAGNDLSAVKVTMDTEALADRLEGIALSIDPGAHTFTFETAGQSAVQKHFVIREAQKERREVISFGAMGKESVSPQPDLGQPLPASAPLSDGHSGLGTQKILAIGAAGVGIVGLGAGAVFGGLAWSKRDSARSVCASTLCDSQNGVAAWKDAKTWGNASTIAFIVGGVGVVAATVLWLGAKAEPVSAPNAQVSLGLGVLDVSGRW